MGEGLDTARTLGRYHLERLLSRGGMGEIYLAHTTGAAGFKKPLVIKKILAHLASQSEFVHRFIDEANIVVSLTHGNIVPVLDMGEVNGEYFIAMEYIPGRDLRDILRRYETLGESMPPALAAWIVFETCQGLTYAHRKCDDHGNLLGIVHRDVSPSNILVSREGVVKLTDFGIAKAVSKLGRSITGQLQGKFCYMSPEQAAGQSLDRRSDIFSMGIIAYELLTGVRPFEGDSDLETLQLVRGGVTSPPSDHNDALDAAVDEVILTALAHDPDQRYEEAIELGSCLLEAVCPSETVHETDLAEELNRLYPGKVPAHEPTGGGLDLDDVLSMEVDRVLQADQPGSAPTLTAPVRVQEGERRVQVAPTPPRAEGGLATSTPRAEITPEPAYPPPTPTPTPTPMPSPGTAWMPMIILVVLGGLVAAALFVWPGYLLSGTLDISCEPPGATVYVDNVIRGRCPVTLEVGPGEHTIEALHSDGLSGRSQITHLDRGEIRQVHVTLTPPEFVRVTVRTSPVAGTFTIDGGAPRPTGQEIQIPPGIYDLEAVAPGYNSTELPDVEIDEMEQVIQIQLRAIPAEPADVGREDATVDAPEVEEVDRGGEEPEDQEEEPEVEPPAEPERRRVRLRVEVHPPEAVLTVDGEVVEVGSDGTYSETYRSDHRPVTVRASLEGFHDAEETFDPEDGSDTVELTLEPALRVLVRLVPVGHYGQGCEATIDGVHHSETLPQGFEIPVGRHRVSIECDNGEVEETIVVTPETTQACFFAECPD